MTTPKHILERLEKRIENKHLRTLDRKEGLIDFSSNDYLSFAQSKELYEQSHQYLLEKNLLSNGSTGSRLLTGNSTFALELEQYLEQYHQAEGALLYISGYNANVGLFSVLSNKNSIVLYDELIHSSIRTGLKLNLAKTYKFKHNSLEDLEKKLIKFQGEELYVSIEAVYSMDGDMPDMKAFADLCEQYGAYLIIDEAHYFATVSKEDYKKYEQEVAPKTLARVITYGKAFGSHGACILTTKEVKSYLVNYSGSFIYTTALCPHSLATIYKAYESYDLQPNRLHELVQYFKGKLKELGLADLFIDSNTPIQACVLGSEALTFKTSILLKEGGYEVRPIFSPTVPKDKERLRFCIHNHNTKEEIDGVLSLLKSVLPQ